MDITAIHAIISSLKAATDISKAMLDLKTTTEVQSKVIALQGALLAAQSSALDATNDQFQLQQRVRELESEIRLLREWGSQEKRYSLVCPWQDPAQVYALKRDQAQGEMPHYLCANCFHERRRVILNPQTRDGHLFMLCASCKAAIQTSHRRGSPPKFAEDCLTQDADN